MESKRKKRRVPKVRSAIPAPKKSDSPQAKSPEELIRHNGDQVEALLASPAWKEIAFPLLQENIAGVSGRFTNGRYWHGTLTSNWKENTSVFVAGYQKALMDFNNMLHDFVVARDRAKDKLKSDELEKQAPLYNPFLGDPDEE